MNSHPWANASEENLIRKCPLRVWAPITSALLSDSGRKPSTTKKLLQWQISKEALRQNAAEEDSLTEEDLKTIALEQVVWNYDNFSVQIAIHLSHFPDGHRWGHPRHRQSHRKTNALNRLWICHLHVCGERKIRAYHKLLLFLRHITVQSKLSFLVLRIIGVSNVKLKITFDSTIGQLAGLFNNFSNKTWGQKPNNE